MAVYVSDDAYKGGGGTGDVGEIDAMEHYNLVTPTMGAFVTRTWQNLFKSIARANVAMRAVERYCRCRLSQQKSKTGQNCVF